MEHEMRITSKGQVTIPVTLREKYGLLPQTEIEFVEQGGQLVLRKACGTSGRGASVVARLRGRATGALGTDAIMALVRGAR